MLGQLRKSRVVHPAGPDRQLVHIAEQGALIFIEQAAIAPVSKALDLRLGEAAGESHRPMLVELVCAVPVLDRAQDRQLAIGPRRVQIEAYCIGDRLVRLGQFRRQGHNQLEVDGVCAARPRRVEHRLHQRIGVRFRDHGDTRDRPVCRRERERKQTNEQRAAYEASSFA